MFDAFYGCADRRQRINCLGGFSRLFTRCVTQIQPDGVHTDIDGAMGEDIDSLFISGGLAAAETKTTQQPNPDALSTYLQTENSSPTFTIGQLR